MNDEDLARHLLRDSAAPPVRDLDPAALRRAADRRARWAYGATAAAACAAVVAGAAGVAALSRGADDVRPADAVACPVLDPPRTWARVTGGRPGPTDVMLSPGATELLVCDYPRHDQPARSVTLSTGDSAGARIVAALQGMESRAARTGFGCMRRSMRELATIATFPDGHREVVLVSPDGCYDVGNGSWRTEYPEADVAGMLIEALEADTSIR
ncbi:MAG TPA: hypothetical protein VF519_12335 [Mycobacteriales bacterium]